MASSCRAAAFLREERSLRKKTSSAAGMNQRANAALAGCAASPLPRWPRACVSARTPPSVRLASGRMMFLRHNQVHLESLRSNARASARFIAALDTKLLRHPFGLCWEFFFSCFWSVYLLSPPAQSWQWESLCFYSLRFIIHSVHSMYL